MNESVLVDTGFWIALFDPRESEHAAAVEKSEFVELLNLVVPWPLLYETLRTRFVKRREWLARLDERLKRSNVCFLGDGDRRVRAYESAIDYSLRRKRPISMADMLCRLIIEDPAVRIDYLLTTNLADYHDVCRRHRVEIL